MLQRLTQKIHVYTKYDKLKQGTSRKRNFMEVKIMGLIDMIVKGVTAAINFGKKIVNTVIAAVTTPSIETVVTAGATVAVTAGVAFIGVKICKKIFGWFTSKNSEMTKPANILEESLRASVERCNSEYNLDGKKSNHSTIVDVLADTFANRREHNNDDADDRAFNAIIDSIRDENHHRYADVEADRAIYRKRKMREGVRPLREERYRDSSLDREISEILGNMTCKRASRYA